MLSSEDPTPPYPDGLRLESVDLFFRHGARTPTAPIFLKELGLPRFWPLCAGVQHRYTGVLPHDGGETDPIFSWRRALETFGPNDDGPVLATGGDSLCNHGELTDQGRAGMVALGAELRRLYIDRLQLFPAIMANPDRITFRSSPYPRALESLQHVIRGFLPAGSRASTFGAPRIVMRSPQEETVLPNEDYCQRFIQISKAYMRRTADRWNHSPEVDYLNTLLGARMPSGQRVAVDGKPRIHGIHDIIHSTAASGSPGLRLPTEFHDAQVKQIVERIAFEEEFGGYEESHELRVLGVGPLLGDVVQRMVQSAQRRDGARLFLAGSHDSTLGAIATALGAVDLRRPGNWPPYGSILAVELFRDEDPGLGDASSPGAPPIGRMPTDALSARQQEALAPYYVRLRYNNQSLVVPGCRAPGRNWRGDERFCTLAAFKEIVDRFTPADWAQGCLTNLDRPGLPERIDPAGY
ncbi:histidine acid phosphatase [Aspergillus heteromorphus CBS 117.55]|uniref:3-phytase n=1 Tax=Aspergillus heteromorphus CBS 117.55 TaxID=1448321 RepID=A0A317WK38_9EURO|nr:histidine acid phosphatase [Aspergillus heteromorphus CBS 117.55]PWY86826.1 histidine acid phosphatase [Aspergillus heteromorphus CBS 117.55]